MTSNTKPFDWCPNIAEDLVDAVAEKIGVDSGVLSENQFRDAVLAVEEVLLSRTPYDPAEHIEHFEKSLKVREDGRQICSALQDDKTDVANLKRCPHFVPLGDTEEDDTFLYCGNSWIEDKLCVCMARPINSQVWRS